MYLMLVEKSSAEDGLSSVEIMLYNAVLSLPFLLFLIIATAEFPQSLFLLFEKVGNGKLYFFSSPFATGILLKKKILCSPPQLFFCFCYSAFSYRVFNASYLQNTSTKIQAISLLYLFFFSAGTFLHILSNLHSFIGHGNCFKLHNVPLHNCKLCANNNNRWSSQRSWLYCKLYYSPSNIY